MLYKVVSIPIYIERFFFEEQDPPVFNSSAILATVALTGFHLDGDSVSPCPRFWHHRCLLASTEKVVAATMVQMEAQDSHPEMTISNVTPHIFRHSKAMHLVQANVNLIYIRDFLGHESVKTTDMQRLILLQKERLLKKQARRSFRKAVTRIKRGMNCLIG